MQLGVIRQLCAEQGADEPEPGHAEHRAPHYHIVSDHAQYMQGLGEDIRIDFQIRCDGWCHRNRTADQMPGNRQADHRRGRGLRSVPGNHQQRHAGDHADQNRNGGAHFHQAVTACEFFRRQHLRQDGVFDRAEQGGLHTGQKQAEQQQRGQAVNEAKGRQTHDSDFHGGGDADQARFLDLLGDLAGGGGKQEVREDEQCRRQIGIQRGLLGAQAHLIHHQRQHGVAEYVVVECAERLRQEKRQEAALLEQFELGVGHGARFR